MPKLQTIYYLRQEKRESIDKIMKILAYIFCKIIGHNKVLESKTDGRVTTHHTLCTQCQRKWFTKKLSSVPKIKFKKHAIKMRAQGQKMIVKTIKEEMLFKPKVNFYTL